MPRVHDQSSRRATRRFISLRTKLVGFISLIIVAVCSGLSWYFIQQQTEAMTRSLLNIGTVLVNNLAHNSRYGLLTEDQVLLGQLIDGAMAVEEVVYVVFTSPEGRLLASQSKGRLTDGKRLPRSPHAPLYPALDASGALFQTTVSEPVITSLTVAGGETVYDFAAPVRRRGQPRHVGPPLSFESQEAQTETGLADESPTRVYGGVHIGLTGEKMLLALHTVIQHVALLTLAIILGGIAAAIVLAGRIITPLRSLAMVANRIAAGDLSAAVEPSTHDEVGQLTRIFNHMAQSLQDRDDAISSHIQTIEQRVATRTQELQDTNRRLEAASRHKSEFLANMSHELRTPMNAIIGFTRLVMRHCQAILPVRQYDNLGKILLSAEHLLGLINGVLDLAKIEAGRMEVQPNRVALEALLDVCLHTLEPMVKSEQLRLVQVLDTNLPMLYTDQDKLKQILMNLLSNAIKFTEAGSITVTARHRDGNMAIAVTDTGIGIPAKDLGLIFEEFRQVDSSTTRQYGGTGLGLSISRHLAHLLGGEITVQSTVGVGSTFTVTLPVRYNVFQPARLLAPALSLEELATPDVQRRVVLAIDDDPNAIYLLQENLAEAGYHVIGATSGEAGLQQARDLRPFAITLDVLMPHKDGWQVLRELKTDVATRAIPIIVLSVVDRKDLGRQLGAFDYLLKPVDREAILAALARISLHQPQTLPDPGLEGG